MEKRLFPFLLFKTLGEFWALLPILVPLYLSCGLKVSDVFLVQRAFALSESVIGIGQSLRSGSDSALLYDTLKEEGREGEYTRWEGRAFFCARSGK